MSRPLKDTFVIELPLVASLSQDAVMLGRFEAGRRIFNAVLGDALKALDLMRQSVQWQKTRGLPKGKERTEAFKACNKQFGFTEYALHSIAIKHKNAAGFEGRLGAHETQKNRLQSFLGGSGILLRKTREASLQRQEPVTPQHRGKVKCSWNQME